MVGSGTGDRSKEAVWMMALHEALRSLCLNSDWTYSVFWTTRPRPRVRGGLGCKAGDDNGSLMLMWEDGFCRGRETESLNEEDPVMKAFSKMSIQLYNYGEGLMGKVASDKCHKWVFKEPAECDCEPNISNYWQTSFDALPPEWAEQFKYGIQTIAVIQAGHGLLQLGSCKTIQEDLHFVMRMRHTFESLGYQSGFYSSQIFSSTRNASQLFDWMPVPTPGGMGLNHPPHFPISSQLELPPPSKDDDTNLRILPDDHMIVEQDNEIKWSDGKFKGSFSLPMMVANSSSSTLLDHRSLDFSDVMEAYLE